MIPLQELRRGNWVMKDDSSEYFKVNKGADIDDYANDFQPIPVTSEVLAKCGFAFHDYFKLWQKNKELAGTGPEMELDRDFWVLDFSHHRIGVEIKGLHQLQNLYFSLKGKELDVKN
jgi:hypothetical protein